MDAFEYLTHSIRRVLANIQRIHTISQQAPKFDEIVSGIDCEYLSSRR